MGANPIHSSVQVFSWEYERDPLAELGQRRTRVGACLREFARPEDAPGPCTISAHATNAITIVDLQEIVSRERQRRQQERASPGGMSSAVKYPDQDQFADVRRFKCRPKLLNTKIIRAVSKSPTLKIAGAFCFDSLRQGAQFGQQGRAE